MARLPVNIQTVLITDVLFIFLCLIFYFLSVYYLLYFYIFLYLPIYLYISVKSIDFVFRSPYFICVLYFSYLFHVYSGAPTRARGTEPHTHGI